MTGGHLGLVWAALGRPDLERVVVDRAWLCEAGAHLPPGAALVAAAEQIGCLASPWSWPGHTGRVFYWAAGSVLGTWAVCSTGQLAVAWAHGPCVLVGGWQWPGHTGRVF